MQVFLVIFVALSSALSISSSSLQVPRSPTNSPKDRAIEDKFRSDEIERIRRGSVTRKERYQTRFTQIKEDFERIQVINSSSLETISFDSALNYGKISEAAAEIKKRATRLKSNLFPAESEGRPKQIEKQANQGEDLKVLLTELDKAITSFVHNPMFENMKIVNPQDSLRAERDLERIIDLSARTRKKSR
jgi:biopolymer transport protein ExbD